MKIVLSSDESKYFETKASILKLSTQDRLILSLKKFFLFLSMAVLAVFIPVLHFILVPIFLILSFALGYKAFQFNHRLEFDNVCKCLQCPQALKQNYLLKDDLKFKCDECGSRYLLAESV